MTQLEVFYHRKDEALPTRRCRVIVFTNYKQIIHWQEGYYDPERDPINFYWEPATKNPIQFVIGWGTIVDLQKLEGD